MGETQYPIVTICGSMRYYEEMLNVAQTLTGNGYIVLMPFVKKGEGSTDIVMLDDMHKTKISMSEAIYVIGAHRGESTLSEIEYAKEHNIEVRYW
jgi:hypothetical protein